MKDSNIPEGFKKSIQKDDNNLKLPSVKRVASFREKVLSWFEVHGRTFAWRRPDATLYVQIVSEVLLQRTRAETVSTFIATFVQNYPSWESLALASEETLAENLRPIGLYRRRATSLKRLAQEIVRRNHIFPVERTDLESIPAVGQYVANAILLFAHEIPAPLLDAGMARLLRRYFDLSPAKADIRYDKLLQLAAHQILGCSSPSVLNWAILDIVASYCKPTTPQCKRCPLYRNCEFRKSSVHIGEKAIASVSDNIFMQVERK